MQKLIFHAHQHKFTSTVVGSEINFKVRPKPGSGGWSSNQLKTNVKWQQILHFKLAISKFGVFFIIISISLRSFDPDHSVEINFNEIAANLW